MADSYQAIYDAVRSRIHGGDVGSAVAEALRNATCGIDQAARIAFEQIAADMTSPFAIYRPTIQQDGNAWICVLGELPTGVIGCGSTPAECAADFNKQWHTKAEAPRASQMASTGESK